MRNFLLLFSLVLLLAAAACSRKQKEEEPVSSLDRVVTTKAPPPNHFLHKTFALRKSETFEIEVPPHILFPRIGGSFTSYRQGSEGRTSDELASIDLLLLDEDEHNDFLRGPGGTATQSVQSSNGHTVDWALRSTTDQPRKYYLVFNNSGNPSPKSVQADFTVSYE